VSESGFTSKQRKKVIYMDDKSTEIGKVKDQNNRKVKGRIVKRNRLCCYFVWPLSFNLSGLNWVALTGV